ncbi:MAG: PQQ-dependent sugar dehydrogenase [Alteromonas oceani]
MDYKYRTPRLIPTGLLCLLFASGCSDDSRPLQPTTYTDPVITEETAIAEPAPVAYEDIRVIIRDVATLPIRPGKRSGARITTLASVKDDSSRFYAVDLDGYVYTIDNEKLINEPFLDVNAALGDVFIRNDTEKGLTSMAFHPNFSRPGLPGFGKFYTATTERYGSGKPDFKEVNTGRTPSHLDVIREWQVSLPDNRVDPTSSRVVMRISHPFRDHTIGQIAFNNSAMPGEPDYARLYIGVGDGGNTVGYKQEINAFHTAQDPQLPLGKILRIDPLARGAQPYTVPPDNPFVNKPPFLPEIWAYGLRNPQRFTWDSAGDHRMILIDIGQALAEEINVGTAGSNYGWSQREGFLNVDRKNNNTFHPLPANDSQFNYTYPALQYEHDLGRAITGGYVYHGALLPKLNGMYIYGDMASGRIFYTQAAALKNGQKAQFGELKLKHNARVKTLSDIQNGANHAQMRFGSDSAGELYILTRGDGTIRKMVMVSG